MLIGCINGCPGRDLVILLFVCRGPTRLLVQTEQTVENNMMSSLPFRMLTISASTFLNSKNPLTIGYIMTTELHI
jgi:hypothetical protein